MVPLRGAALPSDDQLDMERPISSVKAQPGVIVVGALLEVYPSNEMAPMATPGSAAIAGNFGVNDLPFVGTGSLLVRDRMTSLPSM